MEKQQIEKELKELKEEFNRKVEQLTAALNEPAKFEVGWYRIKKQDDNYYQPLDALIHYPEGYGLNHKAGWCHDYNMEPQHWKEHTIFPATPSEVKDALVKEAEKRGFKEGVTIKWHGIFNGWGPNETRHIIPGNYDLYNNMRNLSIGIICIFTEGDWATIVKDEPIMIGGYEVVIHPRAQETSIFIHIFTKDFWQAAKLISEHSKAKIMIGCSKQFDVSIETINKILKRL